MRSFAFSSIQDQRAGLEREAEEGRNCVSFTCLSACLSSLHPCYTVSERETLKLADRQTDTSTLSSSPPPSSHIWLGFLFGLSFLGLCFFWYGFIFGILLQKKRKKKPAPVTTVHPSFIPPCPFLSGGFRSKGSVP